MDAFTRQFAQGVLATAVNIATCRRLRHPLSRFTWNTSSPSSMWIWYATSWVISHTHVTDATHQRPESFKH